VSSRRKDAKVSKVYFIQSGGEGGPIKIGHAINVERRLASLQTASPQELTLLHAVDGGEKLENDLHIMFYEHWIRGEWFRRWQKFSTTSRLRSGKRRMPKIRGFKAIAQRLEEWWGIPVSSKTAWRYSISKADPLPAIVIRNVVHTDEQRLRDWAERNCEKRGWKG
jgi:hypothetical protein